MKHFNQPLVRLRNFWEEGAVRYGRKRVNERPGLPVLRPCHIPGDVNVDAKADDGDWRRNRTWILLQSPTQGPYHPVFLENDEFYWWFIAEVKTPYFAMRIGEKDLRFFVLDTKGFVHTPVTVSRDGIAGNLTVDGSMILSTPHDKAVKSGFLLKTGGKISVEQITLV